MKKILTVFALLFSLNSFAQAPTLDWVKSFGGTGGDYGTSTIIDGNGNVYSTGFFTATVDFDPGTGVFNLTSNGSEDIYLLKLDMNGNFLWAVAFGSSTPSNSVVEKGMDLDIDSQGNIIILGNHSGTCNFDFGVTNFTLVSNGYSDVFIAKYTALGSFLWAKGVGGNNYDYPSTIEIDVNDNIYVSGSFYGTVDFDPGIGVFQISPSPNNDGSNTTSTQIFQLKLNGNGDFLWANQTGDFSSDFAFSTIDSFGNVFSTGRFSGTCDFNPGPASFNLTSTSQYYGIFVRKLDTNGSFLWAHAFNGSLNSEGTSIVIDNNGDVIITGFYQGTVDFDPSVNVFNLTSNGSTDGFILKLNGNGDFLWANTFGSSNPAAEYFSCVKSDNQNNIYAIGTSLDMINLIDMDPGSNSSFLVNNYGTFLIKLNQNGDFIYAISPELSTGNNNIQLCQTSTGGGGGGIDGGTCLFVSNDAIYITSAFQSTIDFDPSINSFNITASIYASDIFIQKLHFCNNSTNTIQVSECYQYTAPSGAIYTSSGIIYDSIPNSTGCDSIIIINLTINQPTSSTISPTVCGFYTAPDGQVYTDNGNYNSVISNFNGCDSTITINLTINQNTSSTQSQTALDSYTWPLNNQTYTQSGTYTATILNAAGCDSVVTLNLTLNFTGITENSEVQISISPNPANKEINILTVSRNVGSPFELIDFTGRKVLSGKIESENSRINIEGISIGNYLLNIGIGSHIKIVIE